MSPARTTLHNEDVEHEHSDINVGRVIASAIILAVVVVVVSQLLMWGLFGSSRAGAANDPHVSPLAAPATDDAEEPRSGSPFFTPETIGRAAAADRRADGLAAAARQGAEAAARLRLGQPGRRRRAHADRRGQEADSSSAGCRCAKARRCRRRSARACRRAARPRAAATITLPAAEQAQPAAARPRRRQAAPPAGAGTRRSAPAPSRTGRAGTETHVRTRD